MIANAFNSWVAFLLLTGWVWLPRIWLCTGWVEQCLLGALVPELLQMQVCGRRCWCSPAGGQLSCTLTFIPRGKAAPPTRWMLAFQFYGKLGAL